MGSRLVLLLSVISPGLLLFPTAGPLYEPCTLLKCSLTIRVLCYFSSLFRVFFHLAAFFFFEFTATNSPLILIVPLPCGPL